MGPKYTWNFCVEIRTVLRPMTSRNLISHSMKIRNGYITFETRAVM